ncbi:MAG: hypothetical protein EZS28_015218 [Streblomastix strix]|uniref:Uncharacterized protein n=1 Tax=Streblomastix strix TaxID=222440 RepID=A0A5J4W2P0_9EUKA|nr:MAG: hypothetical protein EZS28_015218 [Streblomastix strix]
MPVRTEQQRYTAMCLFNYIYDKSLAVEVAVSGILNKYDCEFQGTYIPDNYKNPTSNEEASEEPNISPLNPKEPDSHIDEVIIKHDGKFASLSQPIYTITNVFNQIQLIAPFDQGGHTYNTFYIDDDRTCKVCVFILYFETKGQATSIQEIGRIPDAILPADGKSMGFPASIYRNDGGYINWLGTQGILNKLKKLVQVVGKGVCWMKDKIVKPIMPITNALLQSLGPTGNDISCCARYISIKAISDALAPQTAVPYVMPVNFTASIPLDDLLIFSAFSEYLNSLFSHFKIKFKINPQVFVYCYVDPVISMAKYYTINKDEQLSSGQEKFKDIDPFFRNCSLTFQQTNMFTQIRCTADLVTGVRAEELTPSGLKNLVCNIKPVTESVRNYIITAVTANVCGYKASDACLNRVQQFYSTRPFVVPAQCIESWAFPSGDALTGLRTSKTFHFLTLLICTNFPDFPMNTLNEQFFTMQLAANNLDNIFEATDEYEDSLATPRGSATRRYNAVSNYTSFFITLQCERNSNGALTFDGLDTQNQNSSIELRGQLIFQGTVDTYYNVETNGKHPSPPILCTVHDAFWLFTPNNGRSCDYDTTHSIDKVIGYVTA